MYLADIGVKCPSCGVKFNSRQLVVTIDTGRRNSELRQDFEGRAEQYEPYTVCTCPSCGRADWTARFEPTKEVATLNQPNSTPHLQFRAAALAAERSGRDFYNVGLLYLNAAWCADDNRAYPQAREYRRLSADSFRKSLFDVSCPVDQRMEIEYLIGELLRRSGDFEASKAHFRQAIPRLSAKYAYMARKLMRLSEASSVESIRFENEGN
ncbi:MAG: hypothetical protein JST89_15880 [Cyanobacteria bacterium SZAS-4]|nr:hypothetical protein [Cyanobacteria bacterium SZAS-4]